MSGVVSLKTNWSTVSTLFNPSRLSILPSAATWVLQASYMHVHGALNCMRCLPFFYVGYDTVEEAVSTAFIERNGRMLWYLTVDLARLR